MYQIHNVNKKKLKVKTNIATLDFLGNVDVRLTTPQVTFTLAVWTCPRLFWLTMYKCVVLQIKSRYMGTETWLRETHFYRFQDLLDREEESGPAELGVAKATINHQSVGGFLLAWTCLHSQLHCFIPVNTLVYPIFYHSFPVSSRLNILPYFIPF